MSGENSFRTGGSRRLLHATYRALRRKLETKFLGSQLQEWRWKARHWYQGDEWIHSYLHSEEHPHRCQILSAVESFCPFGSILEVGCNSGPNLLLLHRKFPEAHLIGIDINPKAVAVGKKYLREARIDQIELSVGRADRIDFPDKSTDIVLTDAILMFVGPEKIETVLSEMGRVARKGLILNEYHTVLPPHGNYDGGRWVYDYGSLMARLFPGADYEFSKSLFTGGLWDQYGTFMELRF